MTVDKVIAKIVELFWPTLYCVKFTYFLL